MEQTGNRLWPEEIVIIKRIDQEFRTAMAIELADIRKRQMAEKNG